VIELFEEEYVQAETQAIAAAFGRKRSLLIDRLRRLGVRFELEPGKTFYIWGNLTSTQRAKRRFCILSGGAQA
jgi:aspartate/methionine/tyrosine aminotransferase